MNESDRVDAYGVDYVEYEELVNVARCEHNPTTPTLNTISPAKKKGSIF
jgi:hypothetical protein